MESPAFPVTRQYHCHKLFESALMLKYVRVCNIRYDPNKGVFLSLLQFPYCSTWAIRWPLEQAKSAQPLKVLIIIHSPPSFQGMNQTAIGSCWSAQEQVLLNFSLIRCTTKFFTSETCKLFLVKKSFKFKPDHTFDLTAAVVGVMG